jgi:hypothetical protein
MSSSFDVKEHIAEYGRAQKGLTFKSVNPGSFNTNYITNMVPRKNDYGGYSLAIPVKPDTGIPNIDISKDYGRYVLAACKPGSPDTILAGGPRYQTPVEMCEDFERGRCLNRSSPPITPLLAHDLLHCSLR